MTRLLAILLGLCLAGPALARGYEGCGPTEVKLAGAALDAAAGMALDAARAVADTDEYARWFGAWSEARGDRVRADLKSVQKALAADKLVVVCLRAGDLDCKGDLYAFVTAQRDLAVFLCPPFFALPSLRDASVGRGDEEAGTREGTIIHEVSHFPSTAGTLDHCYGRTPCAEMAVRDPVRAVRTAESMQFFAEHVHLRLLLAKDE